MAALATDIGLDDMINLGLEPDINPQLMEALDWTPIPPLLATRKIGTLCDPRDQAGGGWFVSSLRALLWARLRSLVFVCTSFLRCRILSRLPLRTSEGVTFPNALW